MVFNKKTLRDLKKEFLRYLLIIIVMVLGIGVSVAYTNVYESVKSTVLDNWEECNVEDGEFAMYMPLDDDQKKSFEDKGAKLEEAFYKDMETDDGLTVRMFKTRENIDLLNLHSGNMPSTDDEIVVDKVFAKNNDLAVGDSIDLGGKTYKISGTVTAVDYLQRIKEFSDAGTSSTFGVAFVTKEAFDVITEDSSDLIYNYIYTLNGASNDELKEYLFSINQIVTPNDTYDSLYSFTERENNSRIVYGYQSVENQKTIGIIAAILVGALVAYIISVFAVNAVNEESQSIGILFAMGYERHKIALQYTKLPVIVAMIGSVLGCISGKFMTSMLISSTYSYPEIKIAFPWYMILFAVVVPVVFAFIINYIAVNKRLNTSPLALLKNESKHKNVKAVKIQSSNFIRGFRLHQLMGDIKSYAVTAFGMILAIMIMMIGIAMDSTISHFADEAVDDVKYQNMYVLSTMPDQMPEHTEVGIIKSYSLKYEPANSYFTVMVAGITPDSKYYDLAPKVEGLNEDEVVVSTAVAEKFGYKVGDTITLKDLLKDEDVSFQVKEIADYSYGFQVFMNLNAMRERYDTSSDYYNTIYSEDPIDTENMSVVYESSYDSVKDTVNNWVKLGRSEFIMFSVISIVIFVIVMFLLVKSMIERSKYNISMLKVMGYENSDISKIYINQNVYIVLAATIIGLPLSKVVIGKLVNMMTSAMKCYMPAYIGAIQFVMAVAVILIAYIISMLIVKRRVNKISLTEVLKNRD